MATRVENMFSLRTLSEAGEKKNEKKKWKKLANTSVLTDFGSNMQSFGRYYIILSKINTCKLRLHVQYVWLCASSFYVIGH